MNTPPKTTTDTRPPRERRPIAMNPSSLAMLRGAEPLGL
jgi:hypothetical protein